MFVTYSPLLKQGDEGIHPIKQCGHAQGLWNSEWEPCLPRAVAATWSELTKPQCRSFLCVAVVQSLSCALLFVTHGLQHTRPPCCSLSSGVCPSSCPLSWWCYPTFSSSATLFSFLPSVFPSIRVFSIELVVGEFPSLWNKDSYFFLG